MSNDFSDKWYLEPPDIQPRKMCDCRNCGWGLYEGDEYYEIDGECYCEDCVEKLYRKIVEEEDVIRENPFEYDREY